MLIKRIRLKDFVIFDDVDIDLSAVKLSTIDGRWANDRRRSNGSGKSALLEAIPYALFGTTRSKQRTDVVRRGAKTSNVILEFISNGRSVKIERGRSNKGDSYAKVFIDGTLAAQQTKNVEAIVSDVLGLDRDLFELIYFFRQDDQYKFVNAGPSERKSFLAKVFDLGAVEACLAEARARAKAAEEALSRARGRLDSVQEQVDRLPPKAALESDLLDAHGDLAFFEVAKLSRDAYLEDIQEDITAARIEIDDYCREASEKKAVCDRLNAELNDRLTQIGKLKVSLESQEQLYQSQKSELESIDVADIDHDSEIAIEHARLHDLNAKRDEAHKLVAKFEHEAGAGDQTIMSLKSVAGGDCPTCSQLVPVHHVEKVVKEIRSKQTRAQSDLDGARDGLKKVAASITAKQKKIDDLRRGKSDQQRADRLRSTIKRVGEALFPLRKEVEENSEKIRDLQQKLAIATSNANAGGLAKSRNELLIPLESFAKAAKALQMPVDYDEAIHRAAKSERSIKHYDELLGMLEEAQGVVEDHKRKVEVANALVDIFGKNGLQAILIENVISAIEQFTNDILLQMQTRFSVSFRTQKETKAGDTRETLDIIVFDNGEERSFETYSGGERTLINLAIRLALSRIISSLHGVVVQSLFLDEVLAALDEVNREEAIKVVAFLAKSFEQVFVISHTNEVKDIVASNIQIERHTDYSEVKITNGRVEAQV